MFLLIKARSGRRDFTRQVSFTATAKPKAGYQRQQFHADPAGVTVLPQVDNAQMELRWPKAAQRRRPTDLRTRPSGPTDD